MLTRPAAEAVAAPQARGRDGRDTTIAALRKENPGQYQNCSVLRSNTMKFMPRGFWAAALDHRHPIALEAEQATLSKKHDDLNWATMGWGYWDLGRVPSLDFNKFVYANQRLEHQGSECTAHAFGGRIGTGPTANT